jgi:hypothetical protein
MGSGGTPCHRLLRDFKMHSIEPRGPACDHDEKRAALGYLHEAWVEARMDGIDGDCLAQACLFAAFAEFVSTYGEEPAARFAEGLARRIRRGEFSLHPIVVNTRQ